MQWDGGGRGGGGGGGGGGRGGGGKGGREKEKDNMYFLGRKKVALFLYKKIPSGGVRGRTEGA